VAVAVPVAPMTLRPEQVDIPQQASWAQQMVEPVRVLLPAVTAADRVVAVVVKREAPVAR